MSQRSADAAEEAISGMKVILVSREGFEGILCARRLWVDFISIISSASQGFVPLPGMVGYGLRSAIPRG
jgi:hypothetical protein